MQITVVTLQEFTQEHGEFIDVPHDGVRGTVYERLFVDGAVAYTDPDGQLTQTQEPPADTFDRTRAELNFLKHKLRRGEDEWNRFSRDLNESANHAVANLSLPPIGDAALKQLEAGKYRLFQLRQQIAACEDVLNNSPEAIEKRELAEANRLERQRRQKQLDRLIDITGDAANAPPKLTPAEIKKMWGHLTPPEVKAMFGNEAVWELFGITVD